MIDQYVEQLSHLGCSIDERYLVLAKLGRGRIGKVVLCKDLSTSQLVAVKYLQ